MVEKSGVEKSGVGKFMVEKSGVENSGVEMSFNSFSTTRNSPLCSDAFLYKFHLNCLEHSICMVVGLRIFCVRTCLQP